MTTIPKEVLISEMQFLGKRLSELAKTFSEDVQLTITAAPNGYINLICSVFDVNGEARVVAMPIRRYYSTVYKAWKEDEEDAYPEVNQAPED